MLQEAVWSTGHLSGEITAGLELFQEGGHEKGGEEQDGGPEQNIRGVGSMMATRCPDKLPVQADTLLQRHAGEKRSDTPLGKGSSMQLSSRCLQRFLRGYLLVER